MSKEAWPDTSQAAAPSLAVGAAAAAASGGPSSAPLTQGIAAGEQQRSGVDAACLAASSPGWAAAGGAFASFFDSRPKVVIEVVGRDSDTSSGGCATSSRAQSTAAPGSSKTDEGPCSGTGGAAGREVAPPPVAGAAAGAVTEALVKSMLGDDAVVEIVWSEGSIGHPHACVPCFHHHNAGGCRRGRECNRCHMPHAMKSAKFRQGAIQRTRCRQIVEAVVAQAGGDVALVLQACDLLGASNEGIARSLRRTAGLTEEEDKSQDASPVLNNASSRPEAAQNVFSF